MGQNFSKIININYNLKEELKLNQEWVRNKTGMFILFFDNVFY